MSRALIAALEKLLGDGGQTPSSTCPVSAFTASQRIALEDLGRRTGALKVRLEGRGSVFEILSLGILASYLQTLRPQHASDIDPTIPLRAANIARSRSSKGRAHGHEIHYLLMKSISKNLIWQNHDDDSNGYFFDLSNATLNAGAGVLAISEQDKWCSSKPLWLVENQALFDRLDWLPDDACGTVAYYAGQLPGRLLSWLASRPRASEVIIFPDYDGVGLLNYARLLEICCVPCRFWLMPNWETLLQTYGNNIVWQNTLSEFKTAVSRLKAVDAPEAVLALCDALAKQGLALEHEAVWLNN